MRVATKSLRNARHPPNPKARKERSKPSPAQPSPVKVKPSSRMDGKIVLPPGAETDSRSKKGHVAIEEIHIATNSTERGYESDRTRHYARVGEGSTARSEAGKAAKGKGRDKESGVRERTVYTHFTNATDTNQLRVVIVAVCECVSLSLSLFLAE